MSEKEEVKQLLSFYSSAMNDKLRKLVDPLNQCFGLNGFFYSMVTPEGYFFQIGNLPELSDYYFSQQLYKHNPFICHPDNYYHNQFFIAGDYPDRKSLELQKQVQQRYGVGNTLVIYKKCEDSAHLLMPTSTDSNIPLNTIYLNNLSALSLFADYFISEWRQYLNKMEPYMFNLAQHMGPRFFKSTTTGNVKSDKKEQFLRQIGAIKTCHSEVKNLSKREKSCIEEFLKGKSAAQIALALNLGRRTIEHYMDNIKMKLDCDSKSELFEKLMVFKSHSLL